LFDPLVAEWFEQKFSAATEPQLLGEGMRIGVTRRPASSSTFPMFPLLLIMDTTIRPGAIAAQHEIRGASILG
jgi:hypothetical protein